MDVNRRNNFFMSIAQQRAREQKYLSLFSFFKNAGKSGILHIESFFFCHFYSHFGAFAAYYTVFLVSLTQIYF